MLSNLLIRNFAIIEEIELKFDPSLNILIGETGAGKSIIIDALQILLGEKASSSLIRQGANKSIIEGVFVLPREHPVWELVNDNEIDLIEHSTKTYQMIIRREINLNSSTRNFINDSPVQLNLLRLIGNLLVDFHGQYAHQLLLDPKKHIDIIDAFANNNELLIEYQNQFRKLQKIQNEYKQFLENKENYHKSIQSKIEDLNLINSINPKPNEDIELLEELKIIENSEVLFRYYSELASVVYDSDNSLLNMLSTARRKMEQIAKFNLQIQTFLSDVDDFEPILKELKNHIIESLEKINYNPERIEEINQRLFNLKNLMRRYGKIDEILEFKQQLQLELQHNIDYETKQKDLELELKDQLKLTEQLATRLSKRRLENKSKFEQQISELLSKLGFNFVHFAIDIKTDNQNLNLKGFDTVEFLISTNKGEEPKPLVNIASGGETSRIMLALKSMAANDLSLPILVFDEIDIGVSGSVAHKIALQMKELSHNHQIIAITHSPQVTASANRVISVQKVEKDNRTITLTNLLNEEQIIFEIAKLLSNSNVSDIAIQNAKELRQSTIN